MCPRLNLAARFYSPLASRNSSSLYRLAYSAKSSRQSRITFSPAAFSAAFSRIEFAGRFVGVGYSSDWHGRTSHATSSPHHP